MTGAEAPGLFPGIRTYETPADLIARLPGHCRRRRVQPARARNLVPAGQRTSRCQVLGDARGRRQDTRHPNQGAPCCLRGTPTAPVDSPPVRVRHAYGNRTSRSRLQPRSSDKRGLGVEEAQRSAPCGCPHVRMRRATYRRQMDRLRASDRWSDALNRVSARCRNKSRFRGTLSPNSGKTPRWS